MTLGALQGLRLVEVGNGLSAPYAAKLLCEMGAEVVKIERPGVGDDTRGFGPFPGDVPDREKSGMFHYLNAGKRSVAVGLGSASGQDVLNALLAKADALLVNGDVAAIESLGLAPQALQPRFPRLVVTTITPFGFGNAMSRYRGHDITVCALGGVTSAVGEATREPLTPPLQLSDYQAGIAAASGTMLALFARERTGQGQHVDISPLDVWATVHQGSGFTNYVSFGKKRRRGGRRRPEAYPFHFLQAKDGMMCLIARDGNQWKRFVQLVGDPVLLEDPRYQDRVAMGLSYPEEVDALLRPWFAERTREEIFALCREHHIPFAPVRRIDEVLACKQLESREFFRPLPARANGVSFVVPGAPYRFSATPVAIAGPAPLLGEHTVAVLRELGHADEDVAALDGSEMK